MGLNWVVNASPLILLGKVNHVHLLCNLVTQLVVPQSVAREIDQGPSDDPARQWLASSGHRFILPDPPHAPLIAAWDLGDGEAAVLAWAAQNGGFEAILDDRAARKCALVHQIPCRGTLGVVWAARRRKLIPSAKPVFDTLIRAGLLVDPELVRAALRLAGE